MGRLVLPPMGSDERAELSKLSSIYKLRCRYGKSTQLASSTLIKARCVCECEYVYCLSNGFIDFIDLLQTDNDTQPWRGGYGTEQLFTVSQVNHSYVKCVMVT